MKHIWVLSLLFLSACFSPQQVTPPVAHRGIPAEIGHGAAVQVRVTDGRVRKDGIIGYWGEKQDAPVTLPASAAADIEREITRGLVDKGFTTEKSGTKLTVTLKDVAYKNIYNFWKIDLQVDAVMEVTAMRSGKKFEHTYTTHTHQDGFYAPSIATNNKYVGQALSDTVDKIVNDAELLQFLTGGK